MVCIPCLYSVCGRPTTIFYTAFKELFYSSIRDTPNKGGALRLKTLIRTKKVQVCGEGGIRTLGTVARTTVFETAPFDRSGTSPVGPQNYGNLLGRNDLAVVFFSPDVIGHWSLVEAGSVAIRNYWYLLCLLPIAYCLLETWYYSNLSDSIGSSFEAFHAG